MNILNIMQCTELGGTERATLELMKGLQQRRHDCRVISLNPLGQLTPALHAQGISAVGLPYRGRGGIMSVRRLHEQVRRRPCDAMIMTGPNLLGMMTLGDVARGRRLLAVHHHHTGEKPAWQWKLMYRVADRTFDAITFPSDFVRREAEALYPPIARKCHTVRNPIAMPPIPTAEQRSAARIALGVPLQAKVIGNAGWLIKRKRFDVFLQVVAKVIRQEVEEDVIGLIAGDGPERARLERLAAALGIADRIHWLGWHQEMSNFYLSLNCLLFNSDWEALSMTALEALSYGVPLVASVEHGGLGEIVVHEKHGILLENHDVDRLVQGVRRSMGKEACTLADAGRVRTEQYCNYESCVAPVEALLACR